MIRLSVIPGFTPVKRSYADFEAAVLAHPFDATVLGQDSTGRNLYLMTYGAATLPVYFTTFSLHGSEWGAAEMGLEFMRRWAEDASPQFRWLRSHFRFAAIPCACPSGFDLTTYKNANGVNLNRNFDNNWDAGVSDPTSLNYRGTAPFSEPETQAIRDQVAALDPLVAMDVHTTTDGGGLDVGKVYLKYRWLLQEIHDATEMRWPEFSMIEWSTGGSATTVGWWGTQTSKNGLPLIPTLLEISSAGDATAATSYGMTALYEVARAAHRYMRKHLVKHGSAGGTP